MSKGAGSFLPLLRVVLSRIFLTPILGRMGILQKLVEWVKFKLEASRLEMLLDVECPHDPLNPCVACDNEARALRW